MQQTPDQLNKKIDGHMTVRVNQATRTLIVKRLINSTRKP